MIFFKILLLVIFVVVDIGLVVPETIQTKYSSIHFITHPPSKKKGGHCGGHGGGLKCICVSGGPIDLYIIY